ncbi:hypothetical protein [Cellulomonas sp. URHB0016]
MSLRPSTRSVTLASVLLGAALCLGVAPAHATDATGPVAGGDLAVEAVSGLPQTHAGAEVTATIEDEDAWCGYLTGVYVYKPAYYSVRTINCRSTDVFVKPVYLNGTFGTCVLVPARHSRHLGGSVVRPMEESQIC